MKNEIDLSGYKNNLIEYVNLYELQEIETGSDEWMDLLSYVVGENIDFETEWTFGSIPVEEWLDELGVEII